MDDEQDVVSAADQRKQRILEKQQERLAKVLGTRQPDAGEADVSGADPESTFNHGEETKTGDSPAPAPPVPDQHIPAAAPASAPAAAPAPGQTPESQLRQRRPVQPDEAASADVPSSQPASWTEPSALASADTDAHPSTTASEPVLINMSKCIVAATYQTHLLRLLASVAMGCMAGYGWELLPVVPAVLQLLVGNLVALFSVAMLLKRDKPRCIDILQQMHIRTAGTIVQTSYKAGVSLLGVAATDATQAVGEVLWAMYSDSGCYLVAATVMHIIA